MLISQTLLTILISVNFIQAPIVPPWPENLGESYRTPTEAGCLKDGVDLGEGVWLNQKRADAVHERLLTLDVYPARCQARLDALEAIHTTELKSALDVMIADLGRDKVLEQIQGNDGYSVWTVAVWTTMGAMVGIVAGAMFVMLENN